MFKQSKLALIVLLVISFNAEQFSCETIPSVYPSWVFRGTNVENNTVLTFNKDDTLFLTCLARASLSGSNFVFSITKGSSPPSNVNVTLNADDSASLVYANAQTVIYDDYNGVYDGYENILFLSKNLIGSVSQYDFKLYMNIAVLRPADAGTYFCSASLTQFFENSYIYTFGNSGAVTIQVNTKPGQAHSTRSNSRNLLTYSAILMSASKLFL